MCVIHVIAPLDLPSGDPLLSPLSILLSSALKQAVATVPFLQGSFLDNHNTFHSQEGGSEGAHYTLLG